MILYSSAKINLGLNILNKRKDNYHNIQTLIYPIKICDFIEIKKIKVLIKLFLNLIINLFLKQIIQLLMLIIYY